MRVNLNPDGIQDVASVHFGLFLLFDDGDDLDHALSRTVVLAVKRSSDVDDFESCCS
jgi:hypothetical protein